MKNILALTFAILALQSLAQNNANTSETHSPKEFSEKSEECVKRHKWSLCDEEIKHNPRDFSAYTARCLLHRNWGRWDDAIKDCTTAIEINPDYAPGFYYRGTVWLRRGIEDKAISDLNAAIRIDPRRASAYAARGFAFFRKEMLDEAASDLNEALMLDSEKRLNKRTIDEKLSEIKRKKDRLAEQKEQKEKGKTMHIGYGTWESYSFRPKSIVEQTLNYSTCATLDGSPNCHWRKHENNPCIVRLFDTGKTINIKNINQTAFRIKRENHNGLIIFTFSDGTITVSGGNLMGLEQDMHRLQKAWGLVFQHCPGIKSAF